MLNALITRAFLFFAYPTKMSGDAVWVSGDTIFGMGQAVDGLTVATPLGQAATNDHRDQNTGNKESFLNFLLLPLSYDELNTQTDNYYVDCGYFVSTGAAVRYVQRRLPAFHPHRCYWQLHRQESKADSLPERSSGSEYRKQGILPEFPPSSIETPFGYPAIPFLVWDRL